MSPEGCSFLLIKNGVVSSLVHETYISPMIYSELMLVVSIIYLGDMFLSNILFRIQYFDEATAVDYAFTISPNSNIGYANRDSAYTAVWIRYQRPVFPP